MKKLIIFDLDGTLLNTIADLAAATNYALEQCNYPTHPEDAYYYFVGNGINKLFERALPEEARTTENVLKIRSHFVPYYNAHNCDLSRPYPGIPELLEALQNAGLQLAVASNKYHEATVKLIERFFPKIHFSAVFGQRDNVPTKPEPHSCRRNYRPVPRPQGGGIICRRFVCGHANREKCPDRNCRSFMGIPPT